MNYKQLLRKYTKPSKKGFNLVELVATIAVIAITSGATLSVFLMVHQVTNDASEITVNQFNVTQMERLIRNEVVVASDIDIALGAGFNTGGAYSADVIENDEYIMYDSVTKSVCFKRADSSGNFKTVFVIDDVSEMQISVAPLNDVVADKDGQPYKFFYNVVTAHYEYSGGFVLNNTKIGSDESMQYAAVKTKTLNWKSGSMDNDYVFAFHREVTDVPDSSTP